MFVVSTFSSNLSCPELAFQATPGSKLSPYPGSILLAALSAVLLPNTYRILSVSLLARAGLLALAAFELPLHDSLRSLPYAVLILVAALFRPVTFNCDHLPPFLDCHFPVRLLLPRASLVVAALTA